MLSARVSQLLAFQLLVTQIASWFNRPEEGDAVHLDAALASVLKNFPEDVFAPTPKSFDRGLAEHGFPRAVARG